MGYRKAMDVLPEDLLLIIQDYVDGEYLYIPRKETCKRTWGEKTRSKEMTAFRNREIYEKYQKGKSTIELAQEYCLSIKSIQGILVKIRKENK